MSSAPGGARLSEFTGPDATAPLLGSAGGGRRVARRPRSGLLSAVNSSRTGQRRAAHGRPSRFRSAGTAHLAPGREVNWGAGGRDGEGLLTRQDLGQSRLSRSPGTGPGPRRPRMPEPLRPSS